MLAVFKYIIIQTNRLATRSSLKFFCQRFVKCCLEVEGRRQHLTNRRQKICNDDRMMPVTICFIIPQNQKQKFYKNHFAILRSLRVTKQSRHLTVDRNSRRRRGKRHCRPHTMSLSLSAATAKLMRRATALTVSIRTLSWPISSNFVAIHPWSVQRIRKPQNRH